VSDQNAGSNATATSGKTMERSLAHISIFAPLSAARGLSLFWSGLFFTAVTAGLSWLFIVGVMHRVA
jgi:hypothetical protein